ncbi:exonuclease [Arthrobacter phage MediumFry]|nr:exonuclease [Arthrobacter phage MediumFry]
MAKQQGTELHDLAATLIKFGQRLPESSKTLNMYVNDAIAYRMTPEQVLAYSINCFGTADAISFRDNFLRIHDLKTGVTKASMRQLEVYAALFCLEYDVKPGEIKIELRLYINDEVQVYEPEVIDIAQIMSTIVTFDRRIDQMKEEAAA